jgi:N-acetylglucosaminyl-diphospho-decaprenol L-rhamnosyltransferase
MKSMVHQPTVEIVFVGYNSEAVIALALASCKLIPNAVAALIDHGPLPTTIEVAEAFAKSIGLPLRTMHEPRNPGFGAGCNLLAKSSSADWLVFLNPDAVIVSWDNDVLIPGSIIGAQQFLPSGKRLHTAGSQYRVKDEITRSWFRRMPLDPSLNGYVGGGAMAIERILHEELGGFDEEFFLFYEDIDLCLRASAKGIGCKIDEKWKVTHELGHSTRSNWWLTLGTSYASGRVFHRRHYGEKRLYDLYVAVDALLRAVRHGRTSKGAAYRKLFRQSANNAFFKSVPIEESLRG